MIMKRVHIIKLFFLLMSIPAWAQNDEIKMEQKMPTEEMQILEVTRQLTLWMIERNTVDMNKTVDEKFTLTHITGYVQQKDEWFAEIEKESMKYYSVKEVKHSVTINGDRATFMNQNLLDARIWGSRNTWRLQQNMQLEKRNGKWIILNSVAKTF
jgi:hypothetical protein